MSVTSWSFPNRVLSGAGAADAAGAELAARGASRVLLVTDRPTLDDGLVEELGTGLKRAKLAHEVFAGAGPIARAADVDEALAAFRDAEAEGVLALGGEGAIEVAKLLRLGLVTSEGLAPWLDPEPPVPSPGPALAPLVAVPTVPGSGAEVRSTTTVRRTDDTAAVLRTPTLRADVTLLDPALVEAGDPLALVEGGFDALAWATEGLVAAEAHPAAEALGSYALDRLARLLAAGADDEGSSARQRAEGWLDAAYLAALAGDAGQGACRSLTRALTGGHVASSGLAAALTLPSVLDYNRSARPGRLALVAAALGARGDDVETLAFEAAGAVRALRRAAGLPAKLSDVMEDEAALPGVAERAARDDAHLDNPRECGESDLVALLRAAW